MIDSGPDPGQTVFGEPYALDYDALYRDKEYGAECDRLEQIFTRCARQPVRSILDLGCGTGTHALLLAGRGYAVTGVDRSISMLTIAKQKLAARLAAARRAGKARPMPIIPNFVEGDIRAIRLERTFDASSLLFAVLGYQRGNDDVLAALRTARVHLNVGGLLVFDVWYGPAVLAIRPGERVKVVPLPGETVIRATAGSLDVRHHLCHVQYQVWRLSEQRVSSHSAENHVMRYFFPLELELLLDTAHFALRHLSSLSDLDQPAGEDTWNVLVAAEAV